MANLYSLSNFYGMAGYGSSLFGGTSSTSLYNSLSQYSTLRSGAYGKLTRSYYGTQNSVQGTSSTRSTSGTSSTSSTSKSYSSYQSAQRANLSSSFAKSSTALSSVKSSAAELKKTADQLTDTQKGNVFEKKTVTAEDGTTSQAYDTKAIYEAVSSFAESYNDTVDSLKNVTSSSVKNAGESLERMTSVMKKSLSGVGISIGTDGKLSVDEKTFKNADMDSVKSLFNGTGSYAGIITSSASRLATQASNQISQTNGSLYGSSASLYNSYLNGSLYNGFF